MTNFRLWSEDMEALRDEAREAVAAGVGFFSEPGPDTTGMSRDEIVAANRSRHFSNMYTVEEASDRELAGVRCRVQKPDGAASAVYLHFHGGGMVAGAPEMMDIPIERRAESAAVYAFLDRRASWLEAGTVTVNANEIQRLPSNPRTDWRNPQQP